MSEDTSPNEAAIEALEEIDGGVTERMRVMRSFTRSRGRIEGRGEIVDVFGPAGAVCFVDPDTGHAISLLSGQVYDVPVETIERIEKRRHRENQTFVKPGSQELGKRYVRPEPLVNLED